MQVQKGEVMLLLFAGSYAVSVYSKNMAKVDIAEQLSESE
jgi:hypothetical protein